MRTDAFDFSLPHGLIAQRPLPNRPDSRLFVLDRFHGNPPHHASFHNLPDFLFPGDVLVLNDSKVLPARLFGRKEGGGAHLEVLLVDEIRTNEWWTLLRPGKRVRPGMQIRFSSPQSGKEVMATVLEKNQEGHYRLSFSGVADISGQLADLGRIPLPPYIDRTPDALDYERYQTIYARSPGSVAAPTAGLHFSDELLHRIAAKGVFIQTVTLHVGLGTFAPVKCADLSGHIMHEERFTLSDETAGCICSAREAGKRIVAVGTTTVRVLESVAAKSIGPLTGSSGRTRIFIYPPYRFRVVDALITNFHLPRSTLLMLVCAFASPGQTGGREMILRAYAEAIRHHYRFFSYGDAMLLL